jgi:2-keto-4-pentenoate hydratase/2-oxohepta-3-ene-1,7-dioic acid hydratase in catechol pathway
MKLVRVGEAGLEKPGIVDRYGAIRDLSGVITDIAGDALLPANLARIARLPLEGLPQAQSGLRVGPCVGSVGKIVCVGLNYRAHASESGMSVPAEPVLFMKATSAISGPFDAVRIPRNSVKTDWEVELGVVIGRPGSHIPANRALDHVAGYCVVNDVSERAFQLERGGQWVKGKSCDTFAPIGPWLVTADEVPDPQALELFLEVDGCRHQDSSTRAMIFGVADLIAYISGFMSLQSGDIISTGTPSGVGMGQKPPRYLMPGQSLRLGVSGLGEQAYMAVSADPAT